MDFDNMFNHNRDRIHLPPPKKLARYKFWKIVFLTFKCEDPFLGEINVKKDNIEEFTEIGKYLDVNELIKVAQCQPSTIDGFPNENIAEYDDTNDGNVITNTCNDCEAVFITNNSLPGHYRNKLQGVTNSCNECVHKTLDKSTLRKHKEYKDKGVKYSCDECDHKASTKGSLQRHKGSC